jgi:hypothetical protein
MVFVQKINPVVRAILVVGAAAGLVVGVTFAALNSQATLIGNTISATAGLQVSTDGTTYGGSIPGFSFSGVVLGDTTGVTKNFKIKNSASAPMSLSLKIPTAPNFTGGIVDQTKVHVKLDCTAPVLAMPSTALSALTAGEVTVTGSLTAGATADCNMNVTLDADAITGATTTTSDPFDLRFTGTGV